MLTYCSPFMIVNQVMVENSIHWRCKSMIENHKDGTCGFGLG